MWPTLWQGPRNLFRFIVLTRINTTPILLSCSRLDGECQCTAVFRSFQRFSVSQFLVVKNMILPPPCFSVGMVLARWWAVCGFLQTWHFYIQAKKSNLGFIRPENCINHKSLTGGVLEKLLCLCKVLFSEQSNTGALSERPLGPWSLLLVQVSCTLIVKVGQACSKIANVYSVNTLKQALADKHIQFWHF